MKKPIYLFLALALVLSSCSKKITVAYSSSSPENNNTIVIMPNDLLAKARMTIDDQTLFTDRDVHTIVIENVPEGEHQINLVSFATRYEYPLDSTFTLKVQEGKVTEKYIFIPPLTKKHKITMFSLKALTIALTVLSATQGTYKSSF